MLAYHFTARDQAGLVLAGRDEDGDYIFIGTTEQWGEAHANEMQFEEAGEWPEPPKNYL